MTRAALLHVLDHSTALGAAEVRELEELAQAFPYCQTAHLLLAKAAHDQGAMLAGQRLRRAATYAADRALLRRLIEATPPPALAVEPLPEPQEEPLPETVATAVPEATPPQPARFVAPRPATEIAQETSLEQALPLTISAQEETAESVPAAIAPVIGQVDALPMPAAETPLPALAPLLALATVPVAAPAAVPSTQAPTPMPLPRSGVLAGVAGAGWAVSTTATAGAAAPAAGAANEATTAAAEPSPLELGLPVATGDVAPATADAEKTAATNDVENVSAAVTGSVAAENSEVVADEAAVESSRATEKFSAAENSAAIEAGPVAAENPPTAATELLPDAAARHSTAPIAAPETLSEPALETPETPAAPETPALAPPVRPPAEAGAARFEYGLAEELDPTPAYLLPGLSDEWTWTLPPKPFVQPALTPAAFLGDAAVGYGWGESTRLGLALMPLPANDQAPDEQAPDQPAGPAPAAFALPLPNDFFAPDALLQQHWADHQPLAPPPPTSLELIETFLRQKPRLSRPALAKTSSEAIADLAAPSTNAPPELVSESLARILARQGKLARAIEVYERLMVKHPEKMAYFATEIQSLQLQQPPLP